ncbi:MAG: hypothetical protein QM749_17380 [Aquabacterium sp.]
MEPDTSPLPEVSTGLVTTPMLDGSPPALRVTGIGWFSGFRGTGLCVGDQIVAVEGEALSRTPTPMQAQQAIGTYGESQRWAQARLSEGAPVKLTVRRRAAPGQGWQLIEITGAVRAAVNVRSEDNRILIGPGGPPEMYENDGFDRSWREWADNFAKYTSKVLDDTLYALSLTSSYELRNLLDMQPRVQLLASKYPGPFARAVQEDFDAMLARLQGAEIVLPDDALDYRQLGEQHADEVREQAQAAWRNIQAELASQTITPLFPAVHPIHGDRAAVTGRYVVLPPLRNRDWVGEAGRTWFVAGSPQDGWYFADAEGDEAVWMLDALARYRRLVLPHIDESYELIGQVQAQPGQLVIGERAYFGLGLKPVAALIGGAMCVDLRQQQDGVVRFAGEQALRAHSASAPPDAASPTEVMRAMVSALKAGELDLWTSLFATWSVETLADGRALFRMNAVEQPARYFEEARRRIMERVFDMRPVWTDDVRVIIPGDAYQGQQRLEEVTVEMQHIGSVDGHYRPISDVTVNRWWTLQRLGTPAAMGPWRITSQQPI